MECVHCRSYNGKFYCKHCLTEKLTDHREELNILTTEKDQAIKEAETFLEKTSTIHSLIVEKNMQSTNINHILEEQQRIKKESKIVAQQIDKLQKDIERRQSILENGKKRLHQARTSKERSITTANEQNIASVMKSWQRTYKMTARTRQILVKEVVSLFDLKPGVVEVDEDDGSIRTAINNNNNNNSNNNNNDPIISRSQDQRIYSSDNIASIHNDHPPLQHSIMPFTRPIQNFEQRRQYEDLYICGVTLPTRLIDVSRYPKDELNSAIGYTTQMLELIVSYLGIKLPFTIFRKDLRLYIRSIPHSRLYQSQSKMPLFLDDDKNFRKFLIGISMLNYDIAYLCYTQGVDIPLSQVANALQNILACCNSPQLGLRSHSTIQQGIINLDYTYDFQQILRQTSLRYRCGSSSLTTNTTNQTIPNSKADQKFFKVRHSDFVGGQYNDEMNLFEFGEDEDDDEDEDEDEDEEDVDDHGLFQTQQQENDKEEEDYDDDENHDETITSSNENWNIVDVMPAFVL
ncbi:unnamed protein product [Cunninghamella echinulata]